MASSSTNPAQQSPEELRTKLPNEIWEMCFAYVYKDVGFQEVESGNFKSFYFNQPGDPDETASAVSSLKPIALMAMNNAGRWLFRGYQKPGQAFERFIQQHHARALSIKKMDWQLDEFDIAAPEGDNGFPVTSIKKHCKSKMIATLCWAQSTYCSANFFRPRRNPVGHNASP